MISHSSPTIVLTVSAVLLGFVAAAPRFSVASGGTQSRPKYRRYAVRQQDRAVGR